MYMCTECSSQRLWRNNLRFCHLMNTVGTPTSIAGDTSAGVDGVSEGVGLSFGGTADEEPLRQLQIAAPITMIAPNISRIGGRLPVGSAVAVVTVLLTCSAVTPGGRFKRCGDRDSK